MSFDSFDMAILAVMVSSFYGRFEDWRQWRHEPLGVNRAIVVATIDPITDLLRLLVGFAWDQQFIFARHAIGDKWIACTSD